jgi:hypothetical protein
MRLLASKHFRVLMLMVTAVCIALDLFTFAAFNGGCQPGTPPGVPRVVPSPGINAANAGTGAVAENLKQGDSNFKQIKTVTAAAPVTPAGPVVVALADNGIAEMAAGQVNADKITKALEDAQTKYDSDLTAKDAQRAAEEKLLQRQITVAKQETVDAKNAAASPFYKMLYIFDGIGVLAVAVGIALWAYSHTLLSETLSIGGGALVVVSITVSVTMQILQRAEPIVAAVVGFVLAGSIALFAGVALYELWVNRKALIEVIGDTLTHRQPAKAYSGTTQKVVQKLAGDAVALPTPSGAAGPSAAAPAPGTAVAKALALSGHGIISGVNAGDPLIS